MLGVNNVSPTLMRYGTPEQQAHLRGIQAGTEVWCQGFSEPGSGSDLASLRTRAVLDEDTDEFVINGEKIWTSEGMEADYCMLLVRTDPDARPHKGISALLVPMDSPGITRRPITQITGEGGFAQVFFDDVRVPRSALLGPLHEGWTVTMTTLSFERVGVIMMAGRLEQTILDVVAELAGRELDPGVRLELADRFAEARLLGLLGQRALGRIAEGGAPGAEHSVIKHAWSLAMQSVGASHLAALGLDGISGTPLTPRAGRLPALPGRDHRGRHHRDHAQHPRRASPRDAALSVDRSGPTVTAPIPDLPTAPPTAVHRRSIIMDSYPLDDEHVTVVGRLTDVEPWADPGHEVIHDMTLTVTVRLADLVITSAVAGMGSFPHAECPFIAPAFAQLEGLSVRRGFTKELRQRLGGVSGCAHLGELARAMGPADRAHQRRVAPPAGVAGDPGRRPGAAPPRQLPCVGGGRPRRAEDGGGLGPRHRALPVPPVATFT